MTRANEERDYREEIAQGKQDAAQSLPRLRAHRQQLMREGGALAVADRKHYVRLIGVSAVAAVVGVYALWTTIFGDKPSIAAWFVAGALAIAAGVLATRWSRARASRERNLDALHQKMHLVGRRIDGAERTVRR